MQANLIVTTIVSWFLLSTYMQSKEISDLYFSSINHPPICIIGLFWVRANSNMPACDGFFLFTCPQHYFNK
jgi:hypothetical protein